MMEFALIFVTAIGIWFVFHSVSLRKENTLLREKLVLLECELGFSIDALERALDKAEDQKAQLVREREFLATYNERLTQIENELEDEGD